MNLKPIEMQIAIPRTNEASNTQNQLLHKPSIDQTVLADHAAKRTEEIRQRSAEVEETSHSKVKDDGEHAGGKQGSQAGSGGQRQAKKQKAAPYHPYKGKHIDISL